MTNKEQHHKSGFPITTEIARFIIVGTAGFLTDAAVLFLLTRSIGIDPFVARLFSFPPAFFVTWLLNRYWTFTNGQKRPIGQQFLAYIFVQISGLATNYAVYAVLLLYATYVFFDPIVALAAASVAAAVVTFALSKTVIFSAPSDKRSLH